MVQPVTRPRGDSFAQLFEALSANVERVIQGKSEQIRLALVCLFAEGHLLIEDVPGVGKTSLAKAIARSIAGTWHRIQFTPDLLPSDVTGVSVWNRAQSQFEFRPGGVFANVVLADEINRASPKTQSALLEAMEERQVTVDAHTYRLERPFIVIATQNPIELEGTYPLPEAQLDRFLMRIPMGYPGRAGGGRDPRVPGRRARQRRRPPTRSRPPPTWSRPRRLRSPTSTSRPAIQTYIVDVADATRRHHELALGVSPRGALALQRAARAYAASAGRDYVLPDDVKRPRPLGARAPPPRDPGSRAARPLRLRRVLRRARRRRRARRHGLRSPDRMRVRPPRGSLLTKRGGTLAGAACGLLVGSRLLGADELAVLGLAGGARSSWPPSSGPGSGGSGSSRTAPSTRCGCRSAAAAGSSSSSPTPGRAPTPLLSVADGFDDGRRAARFLVAPIAPGETAPRRVPGPHDPAGPVPGSVRSWPRVTDPFGVARRDVDDRGPRRRRRVPAGARRSSRPASARGREPGPDPGLNARPRARRARRVPDAARLRGRRRAAARALAYDRAHRPIWSCARTRRRGCPRVSVVLDVRPSAFDERSFETAVEAAASVCTSLRRERRPVDARHRRGPDPDRRRNRDAPHALLEQLATHRARAGPDRLAPVLAGLRRRRDAGLVVAIVGRLDPDTGRALDRLAAHLTVVAVVVVPSMPIPRAARPTSWSTRPKSPSPSRLEPGDPPMDLHRRLLPSAALAALSVAVAASFGRVFASAAYLWPLVGAAHRAPRDRARCSAPAGPELPCSPSWCRSSGSRAYVVWGLLAAHDERSGFPAAHDDPRAEPPPRRRAGPCCATTRCRCRRSTGAILLAVIAIWIMAQIADVVAFDAEATPGRARARDHDVHLALPRSGPTAARPLSTVAVGVTAAMFLAVQHQTGARPPPHAGRRAPGSRSRPQRLLLAAAAITAIGAAPARVSSIVPGSSRARAPVRSSTCTSSGASDSNPSYRTSIAPLIDVGAKLNRSTPEELFTVRSAQCRTTGASPRSTTTARRVAVSGRCPPQGDDAIGEGLDETRRRADAVTPGVPIGPLDERWMPAAYRPVQREPRRHARRSRVVDARDRRAVGQRACTTRVVSAPPPTPASRRAAGRDRAARARRRSRRYTELPADFPPLVKRRGRRASRDAYATPLREGAGAARLLPRRQLRVRPDGRPRRRRGRARPAFLVRAEARLLRPVRERVRDDGARDRDPRARRGRLHAGDVRRARRRLPRHAPRTRTPGPRSGSPASGGPTSSTRPRPRAPGRRGGSDLPNEPPDPGRRRRPHRQRRRRP